jgi:hypothetical protein
MHANQLGKVMHTWEGARLLHPHPHTNSQLAVALRTMESMNVDLGVFMETKLIKDPHMHGGCGCTVCATESDDTHQGGGVALLHKEAKDWCVEGVKTFGPIVSGAMLVSGSWTRSIIGACGPPSKEDGSQDFGIDRACSQQVMAQPNHAAAGGSECRPA